MDPPGSGLNQPIKDFQENHSIYAEDAHARLFIKNQTIGPLIWICMILDLDPDTFRSVYQEREEVSYDATPQNMTTGRVWTFGYKPQQLSNLPLT